MDVGVNIEESEVLQKVFLERFLVIKLQVLLYIIGLTQCGNTENFQERAGSIFSSPWEWPTKYMIANVISKDMSGERTTPRRVL